MVLSLRCSVLILTVLSAVGCESDPTCTTNAKEVEIAAKETRVTCSLEGKTIRVKTKVVGCVIGAPTCTLAPGENEGTATLTPSLVSRTCFGDPPANSCGDFDVDCAGAFPGAGTYQMDRAEGADPLQVTIAADGSCRTQ